MLHGTHALGFEPLVRTVEAILSEPPYGGLAVCVYEHGVPVFDMWGGTKNAHGDAWEKRTPAVCFSTTKGVAATALHVVRDRGLVRYDDPVARYWPEFAQNGKGAITVRQALTHSAGLYDVRSMVQHADQLLDWDATTRAIARAPARHPPGLYHAYHAVTYGHLIGEIVQRVSGKRFSRFIREDIAEPLGLRDFFIGAPDEAISRAARNVRTAPGKTSDETRERRRVRLRTKIEGMRLLARGLRMFGLPMSPERLERAFSPRGIERWDFSSPEVLRACIPSVNGLFSARDLARMYAVLAAGGALDGTRLLSPATVREATQIHTRGPDGILVAPMFWRLGYHGVVTKYGIVRGAFGHSGYNGSGAWASPAYDASLAYVVNAGFGTPLGDWRLVKINTSALACLKARKKRAA